MDLTTRVSLVQNLLTTKEIPASVGARLLDINRTSIYYKGAPISDEELACKEIIDHLHTDNPTWGARQMSAQLKTRGYQVGRRKARRYYLPDLSKDESFQANAAGESMSISSS